MKPFARAECVHREAGTRRRAGTVTKLTITAAAIAAVSAVAALPASAEVEAPRNLELNHSIELGVLEEYAVGDTVLVEIWRGSTIDPATHAISGGVRIAQHVAELNDANINNKGGTTYDINHIGPASVDAGFAKVDCWDTTGDGAWVDGEDGTPDVIPGDLMVATKLVGGNPTDDVDYVFIRDVAFTEDDQGRLSGHALGVETAGVFNLATPIVVGGDPEVGGGVLMEAKRVAADTFDLLFQPGDIDQVDGSFTNVGPLEGGPGGEVFIDTIDTNGGGTGNTVTFVDGTPPEDTGCGAPLSTSLTSNTHPVINSANQNSPMTVGGLETGPATVDTLEFPPGVEHAVTHNVNGTWSATIGDVSGLPEGTHALVATLTDASTLTRSVLKDVTAPVLSASPPAGTYTGTTGVALSSDGGELVRFTQDGTVPNDSSRAFDGVPISLGTGSHTIRAFSVDAAGNRSDQTFSYTINAPAGAAAGGGAAGGAVGGAGAGGAAGGGAAGEVLARITGLRAIRLTLAQARRRGILISFNVPNGARFVRVTLFRQTNAARHNTRRLVVRRTFAVSRSGRHTFRINDRRTRRKLVRGKYVIQVAPGVSDSSFQEATARRFTIR